MEENGWRIKESEPLKITIEIPKGASVHGLTKKLRENFVECEYADSDFLVFMLSPENTEDDFKKLINALGENKIPYTEKEVLPMARTKQVMTIRNAMLSIPKKVCIKNALGKISRVPTVSCPPAIPIAVPGELIDEDILELFQYYGIKEIDVVSRLD